MMNKIQFNNLIEDDMCCFALSSRANHSFLPNTVFEKPLEMIDSDGPKNLRFAILLNVINGVVYGGIMGMPAWVMVDCALLPSAFIGVQGPASLLSPEMRKKINSALENALNDGMWIAHQRALLPDISGKLKDDEVIPLAEFCAVPTLDPQRIVGFSLYSLLPGLATIAKAVGLDVFRQRGATTQFGIAQYDNIALRTHTRFGSLQIREVRTPLHSKADQTFVYSLVIPTEDDLKKIANGESLQENQEPTFWLNPEDYETLNEMDFNHRCGTYEYKIIAPGFDPKKGTAIQI